MAEKDPLDLLLDEAVAQVVEDKKVAENRRKAAKLSGDDPERKQMLKEISEWDAKRLWETVSNVAVIRERRCACGHVERWMDGWFKKQIHRHIGQTTRLEAGAQPGMSGSVEIHQAAPVQWCSSCVAERLGKGVGPC